MIQVCIKRLIIKLKHVTIGAYIGIIIGLILSYGAVVGIGFYNDSIFEPDRNAFLLKYEMHTCYSIVESIKGVIIGSSIGAIAGVTSPIWIPQIIACYAFGYTYIPNCTCIDFKKIECKYP